jgi:hypothetical protein
MIALIYIAGFIGIVICVLKYIDYRIHNPRNNKQ